MSDLKERVGYMTGGNANLVPYKGALITGDGEQTVYSIPTGNGLVPISDDTEPDGIRWGVAGAGPSLSLGFGNEADLQSTDSAVDTVVWEAVVDFSVFTPGDSLSFVVGMVGYGATDAPTTRPVLKVIVGATNSQAPAGGTTVINAPFGDTTIPAVGGASDTTPAPVGQQLVQVTIRGGTEGEGPSDFTGSVRSGVLTIKKA